MCTINGMTFRVPLCMWKETTNILALICVSSYMGKRFLTIFFEGMFTPLYPALKSPFPLGYFRPKAKRTRYFSYSDGFLNKISI